MTFSGEINFDGLIGPTHNYAGLSQGNLASQKEVEDAAKDKSAMDMGLRAKQLKSMMRILTYKAGLSGTTILFSNHTYENPGALHPTLVKTASGGSGPQYMASVLVQLANKKERQDASNEDDEMLSEARNYSGATLRFLTTKNRFVPPFLQAEIYLNFRTGLDRYSGLKDMAVNHTNVTKVELIPQKQYYTTYADVFGKDTVDLIDHKRMFNDYGQSYDRQSLRKDFN